MRILLCIDDTDNIESRGTGELATLISKEIEERNWGKCKGITRHQLFVHPDVPYTSHNSSMCFEADINEVCLNDIISYASDFLEKESAEGSDPGLCVISIDKLSQTEMLMEFGRKAKKEIITIPQAYDLAERLGVHLSEHGGTGQGVIGALAGAGLRLSGNDGRFKGKIKIESETGIENVNYILSKTGFDRVKDINGTDCKGDEVVILGEVKAVLLEGKSTLLVFANNGKNTGRTLWETCTKQQIKSF
ncbi:MAG: hypothetical protein WCQ54_09735 [Clostridiaceae bacterium]